MAELHDDGFWVRVARVVDEVTETVQVVIYGFPTLMVSRRLKDVDHFNFLIERCEVLSEFILEVSPFSKPEFTSFRLQFKLSGGPSTRTASLHI